MKTINAEIDGIKYRAVNVLLKPDCRLIIRFRSTSGQTLACDLQTLHHVRWQENERTFFVNARLQSIGNNTRIREIEFRIVCEQTQGTQKPV